MENINRAIKILYKNNTQLDLDLLKLAEVSEKNPSQFKFLLNALRTM
jgi:AraC-like DNA-binding protein